MDQNQSSLTQTASDAPTAPAGETAEQLKARIAELEKQSEGRLRDLQRERERRQELETRANTPPAPPAVNGNEQDAVAQVLKPYLDPVTERLKYAEAFVRNTYRDKALDYLASKTGKAKESVLEDKDLDSRLTDIVKRYGFTGNLYDVTQKAYQIMELENLQSQERERKRTAEASSHQSLPTGTHEAPKAGKRVMSQEEWDKMPLYEYEKLSQGGSFVADERNGTVTFTPYSK